MRKPTDGDKCPINATPALVLVTKGTLSSTHTPDTGCSTRTRSWLITASPGQRINISMVDFGVPSGQMQHQGRGACVPRGFLLESRLSVNRTICGGVARQHSLYTAASSSVEVVILPTQPDQAPFIIDFEGIVPSYVSFCMVYLYEIIYTLGSLY